MKRSLLLISLFLFAACIAPAQTGSGTAISQTPALTSEQLARLDRAEAKLKDWPNLGRYREANSKLAPPVKGEDRVVFMGDSITDSWKLNEYFPNKPYVNRGISGQTTPQMLIRFRPDVIALQPRVIVILAGTNDLAGNTGPMSVESIEDNIRSMTELAMLHGMRVVLASILPVNDYGKTKDGAPIIRTAQRDPAKIIAINEWMKKYAADNKQIYLDYYSAFVDEKGFMKGELSRDGLHPNQKGYELMKSLAEPAIQTALKAKRRK